MRYLLDTCSFLWLALNPEDLSEKASICLDDPSHSLCISETSALEIAIKFSGGKLELPEPPRDWIPFTLDFHNIESLPVTMDVIFQSGELERVHSDPFDRLIAAHTISTRAVVVSPDKQLSNLGAARLW